MESEHCNFFCAKIWYNFQCIVKSNNNIKPWGGDYLVLCAAFQSYREIREVVCGGAKPAAASYEANSEDTPPFSVPSKVLSKKRRKFLSQMGDTWCLLKNELKPTN